jgi:hypothetical protein
MVEQSWKVGSCQSFFCGGIGPLCTIWQGTSSDFMATFWQVYPQQTCQKANFCWFWPSRTSFLPHFECLNQWDSPTAMQIMGPIKTYTYMVNYGDVWGNHVPLPCLMQGCHDLHDPALLISGGQWLLSAKAQRCFFSPWPRLATRLHHPMEIASCAVAKPIINHPRFVHLFK